MKRIRPHRRWALRRLAPAALGAIAFAAAGSAGPAGSAIEVVRLGDKAAVFRVGPGDPTNALAVVSRRGLVLVDTGLIPSRGKTLRAAVEKTFGRRDFAFVINTHAHLDHTDGNQAFADVPIIGHAAVAREMRDWYGTAEARERFAAARVSFRRRVEEQLAKAAPGSAEAERLRRSLSANAALIEEFRSGAMVCTPPTVLFQDRMRLDLDDLTLELVYFGPAHLTSDILIHIPQLRLLAVGDVFHKDWLPQIVGPADPARWLRVLASLPTGDKAVETVVPGHGGLLGGAELRAREAYLRSVWEGVAAARRNGLTLEAALAGLPFDGRDPALGVIGRGLHGVLLRDDRHGTEPGGLDREAQARQAAADDQKIRSDLHRLPCLSCPPYTRFMLQIKEKMC